MNAFCLPSSLVRIYLRFLQFFFIFIVVSFIFFIVVADRCIGGCFVRRGGGGEEVSGNGDITVRALGIF